MNAPRKTTAKKTARKPPAQKQAAPEPQHNTSMAIADQGAFVRALGLDPSVIVLNSVTVEFSPQGVALVRYTTFMPVAPHELGFAFMASAGALGGGAAPEPATEADQKQDGEQP